MAPTTIIRAMRKIVHGVKKDEVFKLRLLVAMNTSTIGRIKTLWKFKVIGMLFTLKFPKDN